MKGLGRHLQADEGRDKSRGKGKGVEDISGGADALVMGNLEVRDIVRIPTAEMVYVSAKRGRNEAQKALSRRFWFR
jgi:hypothetical protein